MKDDINKKDIVVDCYETNPKKQFEELIQSFTENLKEASSNQGKVVIQHIALDKLRIRTTFYAETRTFNENIENSK